MANYWIKKCNGPVNGVPTAGQAGGITTDSLGNIYTVYYSTVNSINYTFLEKHDKYGFLIKSISINASSGTAGNTPYSVKIDGDGNVYVGLNSSADGNSDIYLFKYDSNLTFLWKKRLYTGSSEGIGVDGLTIDSSNNVYITGYNGSKVLLLKLDSSGTILLQRSYGWDRSDYGDSIAVSSSGDIYISGTYDPNYAGYYFKTLFKFNSSGGNQWFNEHWYESHYSTYGQSIVKIDSAGNIYFISDVAVSQNNRTHIIKYNSSGTIVWKKRLDGINAAPMAADIDSAGNIYVTTYGNIVKIDSNGSLVWQRKFTGTGINFNNCKLCVNDAENSMYFYSKNGTEFSPYLIKLPLDGTGAGTYGVIVYGDSTTLSLVNATITTQQWNLYQNTLSFSNTATSVLNSTTLVNYLELTQ